MRGRHESPGGPELAFGSKGSWYLPSNLAKLGDSRMKNLLLPRGSLAWPLLGSCVFGHV